MITVTLDTNCIIDLERKQGCWPYIQDLRDLHRKGTIDVAHVAISASEKNMAGEFPETNYKIFQKRLKKVGLDDTTEILPILYWDVTFYDHCLWCDDKMLSDLEQVYKLLFPKRSFVFCSNDVEEDVKKQTPHWRKWVNRLCDAQMLWSHWHVNRTIFVSNDRNFHKETKKEALEKLCGTIILRPDEAIEYVRKSS